MTDTPIAEEAATPVEEATTPPPHPDLGKWVWHVHGPSPFGDPGVVKQAAKVVAINPETGAYLLGLPGLPPVEVEELPDALPENRWSQLDNAAMMFDEVYRIQADLAAISPPNTPPTDPAALGQYILTRDLFSLLADISNQQNKALGLIGNQQREIAKALFSLLPKADLVVEQAKTIGSGSV